MLAIRRTLIPLIAILPLGLLAQTPVSVAEPLKQINFEGGELKAYVNKVRAEFSTANIVIDSGLGDMKLPPAPLPKVSLTGALQWVTSTSSGQDNGIILQPPRVTRDGDVFVLTRSSSAIARRRAADDHQVTSIALARYEERGLDIDPMVVAEAIKDHLSQQASGRGTVTFNPKTRMLLVTGTGADINGANNVLEQLTNRRRVERQLPQLTDQVTRLTTEVAKLRDSVNKLLGTRKTAALKDSTKH
jgi:type II secretory pathway component GspD/PulD (secretin)